MGQRERILDALERGSVCGTTFLSWGMGRFGARIKELRDTGEIIETAPCKLGHEHKDRQSMYVLHRQSQQDIDYCVCGADLGGIDYADADGRMRVEHKGVWV